MCREHTALTAKGGFVNIQSIRNGHTMPAISIKPYIVARGHGDTLSELKRYGDPMKLCLCGRCARAFYNLSDHVVRRVDHNQQFKGRCDYCNQRYGYDYYVLNKMIMSPSH